MCSFLINHASLATEMINITFLPFSPTSSLSDAAILRISWPLMRFCWPSGAGAIKLALYGIMLLTASLARRLLCFCDSLKRNSLICKEKIQIKPSLNCKVTCLCLNISSSTSPSRVMMILTRSIFTSPS